jgi:YVTN family beta-propeller protein
MRPHKRTGSPIARTRGFALAWALLGMLAGLSTWPAEAAPFTYVTSLADDTVSVLDTATNAVSTIPLPHAGPCGVALAPDGKRAYVANNRIDTVSVIETTNNTVAATVSVGPGPAGIAIAPDGEHAYVANSGSNTVSLIDTATNTVATVTVGNGPIWVATVVSPTVNIPSCGASACAQGFIGDFPQQGAATGQMRQFLGIRYAAAPRGANRWNPPKPFFCWGGTRQFTAFGNHCASPPSPSGNPNVNEDCLFLNIFTWRRPTGVVSNFCGIF